MRNEQGQFIKGSSGNLSGRPTRADEQFLIDLWDEQGKEQFSEAIEKGERWALKVLMDKLYSNKKPEVAFHEFEKPTPILDMFFGKTALEAKERANKAVNDYLENKA